MSFRGRGGFGGRGHGGGRGGGRGGFRQENFGPPEKVIGMDLLYFFFILILMDSYGSLKAFE